MMAASRNNEAIIPFEESEQRAKLQAYNETKHNIPDKIPVVPRNFVSGWPLIQVSLFAADDSQEHLTYQPVLGGGTCHFIPIGGFSFAGLLAKIPGSVKCEKPYDDETVAPEKFTLDNIHTFLQGFKIYHPGTGMGVACESMGSIGKKLYLIAPLGDNRKLLAALEKVFSYAVKKNSGIIAIEGWYDAKPLTAEQIQSGINRDIAVFYNGQIFVDLGILLDQKVKDPEIREYLASIFKVAEFQQLKLQDTGFKPAFINRKRIGLFSSDNGEEEKIALPPSPRNGI